MPGPPLIYLEDNPALALAEARTALGQSNGVIVFPTDTVYGLLAGLESEAGYRKIFAIKQRPLTQPLQILALPQTTLAQAVQATLTPWPDWLARFQAGQATVVLDAACFAALPAAIPRFQPGPVGVRVPSYTPLRELLASLPHCSVWATSANVSGSPVISTSAQLILGLDSALAGATLVVASHLPLATAASQVIQLKHGAIAILRD